MAAAITLPFSGNDTTNIVVYSSDNSMDTYDVVQSNFYRELSHQLMLYVSPCILIVGTIGNILTIIIMRKLGSRDASSTLYYMVLAIVDLLILYLGIFRYWLRELQGTDMRTLSVETCKLHTFLIHVFIGFSSWILVSLTIQRLVAVSFPLQVAILYTTRRIVIGLIITIVVLIFINLHLFWSLHFKDGICKYATGWEVWEDTWQWIDMAIYCFLPFTILLLSYLMIIKQLVHLNGQRNRSFRIRQRNGIAKNTPMFLAVTFTFLILTSPIGIVQIGYYHFFPDEGKLTQSRYILTFAIVNLLYYLNNASNFFLYCLSGRKFRKALLSLIKTKREQLSSITTRS